MASAILTVFNPKVYTVIDVRPIATLQVLDFGALGFERPEWLNEKNTTENSWVYGEYVELCRAIAKKLGVSLRDLDRALWGLDGKTPAA
jgi:hypothetical protein